MTKTEQNYITYEKQLFERIQNIDEYTSDSAMYIIPTKISNQKYLKISSQGFTVIDPITKESYYEKKPLQENFSNIDDYEKEKGKYIHKILQEYLKIDTPAVLTEEYVKKNILYKDKQYTIPEKEKYIEWFLSDFSKKLKQVDKNGYLKNLRPLIKYDKLEYYTKELCEKYINVAKDNFLYNEAVEYSRIYKYSFENVLTKNDILTELDKMEQTKKYQKELIQKFKNINISSVRDKAERDEIVYQFTKKYLKTCSFVKVSPINNLHLDLSLDMYNDVQKKSTKFTPAHSKENLEKVFSKLKTDIKDYLENPNEQNIAKKNAVFYHLDKMKSNMDIDINMETFNGIFEYAKDTTMSLFTNTESLFVTDIEELAKVNEKTVENLINDIEKTRNIKVQEEVIIARKEQTPFVRSFSRNNFKKDINEDLWER